MSGPGGTSACIFSFWIDMPVCDPPFGNETHLPHSGRMHSCPNTDVLMTIAAKTIKPRIHFLLFKAIARRNITVPGRLHLEVPATRELRVGPPFQSERDRRHPREEGSGDGDDDAEPDFLRL